MSKIRKIFLLLLAVILILQSLSCTSPTDTSTSDSAPDAEQAEVVTDEAAEKDTSEAKEEVSEEPAIVFLLMPGEPPETERTLADSDSSIRAYENRAVSGDKFLESLYERPFTSQEMVYQPDLDIITVDFANDENFFISQSICMAFTRTQQF